MMNEKERAWMMSFTATGKKKKKKKKKKPLMQRSVLIQLNLKDLNNSQIKYEDLWCFIRVVKQWQNKEVAIMIL